MKSLVTRIGAGAAVAAFVLLSSAPAVFAGDSHHEDWNHDWKNEWKEWKKDDLDHWDFVLNRHWDWKEFHSPDWCGK